MTSLALAAEEYLAWLRSHGYAKTTVAGRAHHLRDLVEFLDALDITEPAAVSFASLESYQRHLFHHKKANGAPLSFRTQAQRIIPVKAFFAWRLAQGRIPFDPAVGLVLPKAEHRLPEATSRPKRPSPCCKDPTSRPSSACATEPSSKCSTRPPSDGPS
jgi:integrase/recombinase XerD